MQRARICVGDKCRNASSGLRNENQAVGVEGRKKCDVRFSLFRRNRVLQENFMTIGVRNLWSDGFGPCWSIYRTSRWHRANSARTVTWASSGHSGTHGCSRSRSLVDMRVVLAVTCRRMIKPRSAKKRVLRLALVLALLRVAQQVSTIVRRVSPSDKCFLSRESVDATSIVCWCLS